MLGDLKERERRKIRRRKREASGGLKKRILVDDCWSKIRTDLQHIIQDWLEKNILYRRIVNFFKMCALK